MSLPKELSKLKKPNPNLDYRRLSDELRKNYVASAIRNVVLIDRGKVLGHIRIPGSIRKLVLAKLPKSKTAKEDVSEYEGNDMAFCIELKRGESLVFGCRGNKTTIKDYELPKVTSPSAMVGIRVLKELDITGRTFWRFELSYDDNGEWRKLTSFTDRVNSEGDAPKAIVPILEARRIGAPMDAIVQTLSYAKDGEKIRRLGIVLSKDMREASKMLHASKIRVLSLAK